MPKVGDIWEAYRTNEFSLMIDGQESPGVSKVSGLSEGEMDTIDQPDGGSNHVYKVATGVMKFETLTIERYVDGSPEDARFKTWFQQTFHLHDPQRGGSGVRKNGMVVKKHNGQTVLTFAFYNAWVKSSKFSDLEAGTNNPFKQTIVLEHEGLERVG
jgi:phage tail-like protein